jgi:thioredoxin reductase
VSYRRDEFVRLKEKNEKRIQNSMKSGKFKLIFSSTVRQITSDSVTIQDGKNILHNLPNDFVFIFAGGELPTDLLKKTGVKLRTSESQMKVA